MPQEVTPSQSARSPRPLCATAPPRRLEQHDVEVGEGDTLRVCGAEAVQLSVRAVSLQLELVARTAAALPL